MNKQKQENPFLDPKLSFRPGAPSLLSARMEGKVWAHPNDNAQPKPVTIKRLENSMVSSAPYKTLNAKDKA